MTRSQRQHRMAAPRRGKGAGGVDALAGSADANRTASGPAVTDRSSARFCCDSRFIAVTNASALRVVVERVAIGGAFLRARQRVGDRQRAGTTRRRRPASAAAGRRDRRCRAARAARPPRAGTSVGHEEAAQQHHAPAARCRATGRDARDARARARGSPRSRPRNNRRAACRTAGCAASCPCPASAALAFCVWPLNTHSKTPTTSVRARVASAISRSTSAGRSSGLNL